MPTMRAYRPSEDQYIKIAGALVPMETCLKERHQYVRLLQTVYRLTAPKANHNGDGRCRVSCEDSKVSFGSPDNTDIDDLFQIVRNPGAEILMCGGESGQKLLLILGYCRSGCLPFKNAINTSGSRLISLPIS